MGIREILKGNKSKELPSESATSNDITDRVALDLFVYGALDDLYTVYLIKPKSSDLGYSVLRLESAHELSFACNEPRSTYRTATIDKKILGIYEQSLSDIGAFRNGSMLNFIYYLPSQTDPKNYFERHFQKPLQECFPNESWEGTMVAFAQALRDLIKRSGYGYSESSYNKCATLDSWSTENLKALLQL